MYKVLAIDRLPDVRNSYSGGNGNSNSGVLNDRKRPRDSNASLDDGEVAG